MMPFEDGDTHEIMGENKGGCWLYNKLIDVTSRSLIFE